MVLTTALPIEHLSCQPRQVNIISNLSGGHGHWHAPQLSTALPHRAKAVPFHEGCCHALRYLPRTGR